MSKGWQFIQHIVIKTGKVGTDIFPKDDLRKHVMSYEDNAPCWCQPQAQPGHPTVQLHNSADGREADEEC